MVSNTSMAGGHHSPAYVLVKMPVPSPGHSFGESGAIQQRFPVYPAMPNQTPQVYGIQNYGVQRYLPIAERRPLTLQEKDEVRKGLSRWWPKIGAGYSTSIPQMLASPIKNSLLVGGFGGSAAGLLAMAERTSVKRFGAIGALIGASLCGIGNYIRRKRQNEIMIDLMQRLPEGATKRDLLSDPAYQEDLKRASITGEGVGKDLSQAFNIIRLIAAAASD